jgi:hypothetical protein
MIDARNHCGLALFGLIVLIIWRALKEPELVAEGGQAVVAGKINGRGGGGRREARRG